MDRNLMPRILEGPGDPMRLGAISRIEADEELLSHGSPLSSGIPGIQAGQHIRFRALPELRRFWSVFGILVKPSDMRTDGRTPTLEAADPPPLKWSDLRYVL
jgi:hypothetical protein